MKKAFTLIELLVTMAIIIALAGLSLAGIASMSRSVSERQERAAAETPFQAAANTAERARMPAFVIVDPSDSTITAYGPELQSTWHFEVEDISAWPLKYDGHSELDLGFAGAGLTTGIPARSDDSPETADAGRARFLPDRKPFSHGGYFECYVHSVMWGQDQVLFQWGETLAFKITAAGRLEGRLGPTTIRNPDVLMDLRRWVRLGFLFTESKLAVFMDGAVTAERRPEEFILPKSGEEACMSSLRTPVQGTVDEARLASMRVIGSWKGRVFQISSPKPFTVWFAENGGLDLKQHPQPVEIPFKGAEDESLTFQVIVETSGEVGRNDKK